MSTSSAIAHRFRLVAEELNELAGLLESRGQQPRSETRTQREIVRDFLMNCDGWATAPKIAELSGVPGSAVRGVLYSDPNLFESKRETPSRVLWRVRDEFRSQPNFEEDGSLARAGFAPA